MEYLILFKMKAWLDLSDRKEKGEQVDSKNVKKHKNDVMRLAVNLQPDASVHISGEVREDAVRFITLVKDDESNLKNLGIRGIAYAEVIEKLENCYGIHVIKTSKGVGK